MSTVGDRIKLARVAAGFTQADLAEKCGWEAGQRRTSFYESGRSSPKYEDLAKIARVLGTTAAYLAFGDVSERDPDLSIDRPGRPGIVAVPELGDENSGQTMIMETGVLEEAKVSPGTAAWYKQEDNSMEPIIPMGSTVVVDTKDTQIRSGRTYVVQHGGLTRVKLAYLLPKGVIRLRSHNDGEWPDEIIESEELDDFGVLGRVFWYSVSLS